jgi:hypothetical protein
LDWFCWRLTYNLIALQHLRIRVRDTFLNSRPLNQLHWASRTKIINPIFHLQLTDSIWKPKKTFLSVSLKSRIFCLLTVSSVIYCSLRYEKNKNVSVIKIRGIFVLKRLKRPLLTWSFSIWNSLKTWPLG